jgi:hypothetical protein
LAERVCFVRTLGIDRKRRSDIPAQAFERLAAEGLRMTAQHLGDLTGSRRHAVLCATVIKLESVLTDAALSMFDKLMGSVARKAARRFDERTLQSAREVSARIQSLTNMAADGFVGPLTYQKLSEAWPEYFTSTKPSCAPR